MLVVSEGPSLGACDIGVHSCVTDEPSQQSYLVTCFSQVTITAIHLKVLPGQMTRLL